MSTVFKHRCPGCSRKIKQYSERYADCLCQECEARLTDKTGRSLRASNIDFFGGFIVHYVDTNEVCDEASDRHKAYLDKVPYYWNEARFGGTVAVPWSDLYENLYGKATLGQAREFLQKSQ